jgi:hypothetical protein
MPGEVFNYAKVSKKGYSDNGYVRVAEVKGIRERATRANEHIYMGR